MIPLTTTANKFQLLNHTTIIYRSMKENKIFYSLFIIIKHLIKYLIFASSLVVLSNCDITFFVVEIVVASGIIHFNYREI
jgi:hypothetical protein